MNRFSSQGVLRNTQRLYEVGEKAAGTAEELEAANLIKNEFERMGLDHASLEPFNVVCRRYRDSELRLLQPIEKDIPCCSAGTSISTPEEGISGILVDAGFGTIRDYEKLRERGIEIEGKIALIERSDRLTYWPDISCRLAHNLGIKAVVITNFVSEHTAFRKEAFPFAPVPAISIPYQQAQELRRILQNEKVILNIRNVVDTDENGVSYNVVADLTGEQWPSELIILSAHHDSWFGGANDNAAGVAIVLEIAEILKTNYRPKRTIRMISFGAEESGSKDYMEWSVGSYAYVKKHHDDAGRTLAQINLDIPSYGDRIAVHTTPEIGSFAERLTKNLELGNIFSVIRQPSHVCDQWSFVMEGVPSITLGPGASGYIGAGGSAYEKIYHTQYDTPDCVSYSLLEPSGKFILACILTLDSSDITPYDFNFTIELLKTQFSTRLDTITGIIDVSGTLNKATEMQALIRKHDNFRDGTVKKNRVESINASQRRIARLLNTKIIGPGGDAGKDAAWINAEYLDVLIALRETVKDLESGNLGLAVETMSSLRTMDWGLNMNLDVYNEVLDSMLKSSRYPTYAIYPNIMAELLSVRRKIKEHLADASEEASSIQEKYALMLEKTKDRVSQLENAITNCIQEAQQFL
jgi:Zn-dependent M28 family amino/carboxypeptidase